MTPEEEKVMKEATDESYAEALMKIIAKQSAKAYPVYQYSYFMNGSRDEQMVIRSDNFEDFKEAKRNIDTIIEKRKSEEKPTQSLICTTCGKPAEFKSGVSKAGKPYSGTFCSSGDKTHTKWQ